MPRFRATIVPKVLQRKSYSGRRPRQAEVYEVDEKERDAMMHSLVGKPILDTHDTTKVAGTIEASYKHPQKSSWLIEYHINDSTPEGQKAVEDIMSGRKRGISLRHDPNTLWPKEASFCEAGARGPDAITHADLHDPQHISRPLLPDVLAALGSIEHNTNEQNSTLFDVFVPLSRQDPSATTAGIDSALQFLDSLFLFDTESVPMSDVKASAPTGGATTAPPPAGASAAATGAGEKATTPAGKAPLSFASSDGKKIISFAANPKKGKTNAAAPTQATKTAGHDGADAMELDEKTEEGVADKNAYASGAKLLDSRMKRVDAIKQALAAGGADETGIHSVAELLRADAEDTHRMLAYNQQLEERCRQMEADKQLRDKAEAEKEAAAQQQRAAEELQAKQALVDADVEWHGVKDPFSSPEQEAEHRETMMQLPLDSVRKIADRHRADLEAIKRNKSLSPLDSIYSSIRQRYETPSKPPANPLLADSQLLPPGYGNALNALEQRAPGTQQQMQQPSSSGQQQQPSQPAQNDVMASAPGWDPISWARMDAPPGIADPYATILNQSVVCNDVIASMGATAPGRPNYFDQYDDSVPKFGGPMYVDGVLQRVEPIAGATLEEHRANPYKCRKGEGANISFAKIGRHLRDPDERASLRLATLAALTHPTFESGRHGDVSKALSAEEMYSDAGLKRITKWTNDMQTKQRQFMQQGSDSFGGGRRAMAR